MVKSDYSSSHTYQSIHRLRVGVVAWGSPLLLARVPSMLFRLEKAVRIEMCVTHTSDKTREKEFSVGKS